MSRMKKQVQWTIKKVAVKGNNNNNNGWGKNPKATIMLQMVNPKGINAGSVNSNTGAFWS